jgi:hypothetical protein
MNLKFNSLFLKILKYFMFLFSVSRSKKVVFPGINMKDLKSVASLLSPKELIVPLLLISILAQISDNLKGLLNYKDIQKLRIRCACLIFYYCSLHRF